MREKIPVNTKFVKFSSELRPVKYIDYDRATAEKGGKLEKEKNIKDLETHNYSNRS